MSEHPTAEDEPQCFNNVDSLQDRISDLERALEEIRSKFPGSTLGYVQYAKEAHRIATEALNP